MIKSVIIALLTIALFSCSKNMDKPFSIENHKKDLDLCYGKGEIDSTQKIILDKYILRAYNMAYHGSLDYDKPEEGYKRSFCDTSGNFLSYKKLLDRIVALDMKDFPLGKITKAIAIYYPKDGTSPFNLKEGKVAKDEFHPEDYELKDSTRTRELSTAEIKELLDGINGYWPTNQYTEYKPAACFMPYYGILLYNENNKVEAYISICFTCGNFYLYPRELYDYKNREKNHINSPMGDMTPFRRVFSDVPKEK